MKIVNQVRYQDNLAKKRQRRFLAVSIASIIAVVALILVIGYALFLSGWFDIKDVSINGLADTRTVPVREVINQKLAERWLGLPTGQNVLLFRSSAMEDYLADEFSFIKTIDIDKNFFHGLILEATERQPEGIWCFQDSCFYYDHGGVLIGPAPKSSGYLTLTVNDMREDKKLIESKFLEAVQTIYAGLESQGIKVKEINIPAGTFTELNAMTAKGYPIRFSIETDLSVQLKALEIFLKQKKGDSYQYLDLRFEGRVYYK